MRALLLPISAVLLLAQETFDLTVVGRIKQEAYDHSKVMEHLSYLTDVYGPRLTGSPEYDQAAGWAVQRLKEYGLANVHLEKWNFGRSWSIQQYAVELVEPRYSLMSATPLAWSTPTNGPLTADLILAPLNIRAIDPKKAAEELDAYKKKWAGTLRGKIVMGDPKTPPELSKPLFHRATDAELAELARAPEPVAKNYQPLSELQFPEDPEEIGKFMAALSPATRDELWDMQDRLAADRNRFFLDEGVAGRLVLDRRAHDGLTFAEAAGSYKTSEPLGPPTFVVTAEQYNRIARLVEKKLPVRVRINLAARVSNSDVQSENIVGEIPGGVKKDEVVFIGAHFDSWHSGTGATDNGAGSAVMIEVMRVLKTLGLKLDRTVRVGLWGGEEQGYLGSRAYAAAHLGDWKTMKLLPEQAKISGYFNFDNGSGRIRGVYLQGNDAMRPLFERWLAPFRDEGVTTISIRNTGGTDHLTFDAVGVPGFQFIQDPLDYGTITHHSSMDTYDHAIPADLMQAAAVIATCVYEAANRPDMLPRKVIPAPSADRSGAGR